MKILCLPYILFTGAPGFWEFVSFIGKDEYREMSLVCRTLKHITDLMRRTAKFGKRLFSLEHVEVAHDRFPNLGTITIDAAFKNLTELQLDKIFTYTNLVKLSLYNNHLTVLPESIGALTALTTLSLDHNQLTGLPDAIGQLTSLKKLSLWSNKLTSLPESIGSLTALTYLCLGSNYITKLPDTFGGMTALTTLSLSYNKLTPLPESIVALTSLTRLQLEHNPFNPFTPQSDEVHAWLQALKKSPTCVFSDRRF